MPIRQIPNEVLGVSVVSEGLSHTCIVTPDGRSQPNGTTEPKHVRMHLIGIIMYEFMRMTMNNMHQ